MQRQQTNRIRTAAVTLESEKSALLALVDQEEGTEYQIGVHFNTIVDGRLWKQGNYSNAPDFFKREVKVLSASMLALYGSVARHFSEEVAQQYGMTNLSALLSYAAKAQLDLPPGNPGPVLIQVPRKDGSVVAKRFADCSRAEILAAVRHARSPDGGDSGGVPREDAREVTLLRQELRNATGMGSPASLKAVFRNGETLVSLEDIPLHQLTSICQALGWPEGPPQSPNAHRKQSRRTPAG